MTEVLPQDDSRVDVERAGVVGRSYGGYMTLTLAGRHPELWSAAVDMFGPYDLLTFSERIPETWKPYFALASGDPEDGPRLPRRALAADAPSGTSPARCSSSRARTTRASSSRSRTTWSSGCASVGKDVEYLVFEDEGHDVLKLPNRVALLRRDRRLLLRAPLLSGC